MKKLLISVLVSIFIFALCACNTEKFAIEDYEWKNSAVMRNDIEVAQNEDELVVAVGEFDELYPDVKIVDLTLTAKEGEITITDVTNDKTYTGTYNVIKKTSKETDYEVIIDGVSGFATASETKYYDDSEVPTLPINLGDYCVYFIPKK